MNLIDIIKESPELFALAGVILTLLANIYIQLRKEGVEKEVALNDDEAQFQDRLLKRIGVQDQKLELQDKRIELLEQTIDKLRNENHTLIDEKHRLERLVRDLEADRLRLEVVIQQFQTELSRFQQQQQSGTGSVV